ncbi:hypothetical protein DPMN_026751 [Dreissena polymorpha]|uniref:Uncharacterized protein n=1 Tax=Dreissena polymorpha TaxID=45954 RepID=A0A9D4LTJ4_DREPO|nr:hypothetical protein DPMN_026751 [Dreissena polymorpha]
MAIFTEIAEDKEEEPTFMSESKEAFSPLQDKVEETCLLCIGNPSVLKNAAETGHSDLHLQMNDLEMTSGHLLILANLHVKFEDSRSKHTKVIP